MKVILHSGRHLDLPWTPANCTGYVAAAIFIEPSDLHQMIRLLDRDPEQLRIAFVQWMGRFPEERIPPSKPVTAMTRTELNERFPKERPEKGSAWEEREAFHKAHRDDRRSDIPLIAVEVCSSCNGTGQPGGVMGGSELGQCSICGGSGKNRKSADWMSEMLKEREAFRESIIADGIQETCPSCHGTGQPGGVMGGPELGNCSICGGSGYIHRSTNGTALGRTELNAEINEYGPSLEVSDAKGDRSA